MKQILIRDNFGLTKGFMKKVIMVVEKEKKININ